MAEKLYRLRKDIYPLVAGDIVARDYMAYFGSDYSEVYYKPGQLFPMFGKKEVSNTEYFEEIGEREGELYVIDSEKYLDIDTNNILVLSKIENSKNGVKKYIFDFGSFSTFDSSVIVRVVSDLSEKKFYIKTRYSKEDGDFVMYKGILYKVTIGEDKVHLEGSKDSWDFSFKNFYVLLEEEKRLKEGLLKEYSSSGLYNRNMEMMRSYKFLYYYSILVNKEKEVNKGYSVVRSSCGKYFVMEFVDRKNRIDIIFSNREDLEMSICLFKEYWEVIL